MKGEREAGRVLAFGYVSKEETTRTWIYDDRWSNYGILKCQPVCKYPDLFDARISRRSSYDELYF
ncbi:hypothetical protein V6Z11_D07G036900 [Gossypium hirsutum]